MHRDRHVFDAMAYLVRVCSGDSNDGNFNHDAIASIAADDDPSTIATAATDADYGDDNGHA